MHRARQLCIELAKRLPCQLCTDQTVVLDHQVLNSLYRAQGHVEILEILVDAGANTQLCAASCSAQKQARLVLFSFLLMIACARNSRHDGLYMQARPGRRSRASLSQRHTPTGVPSLAEVRSASQLCKNTTVRYALSHRLSTLTDSEAFWCMHSCHSI